jgi:hypothetical protein
VGGIGVEKLLEKSFGRKIVRLRFKVAEIEIDVYDTLHYRGSVPGQSGSIPVPTKSESESISSAFCGCLRLGIAQGRKKAEG